jgi:uncharacterized protein YjdB/N-acetylneuraminic acid mutarotase
VTAQELDASLSPTGKQYSYQINSDLGTFSPTSAFTSQYIGLNATGYYFDELANAVSGGPITLNSYADLGAVQVLNVNLLTTLAYQRIQYLVTVSKMTFAAATTQAEREVLAVFNIPTGAYGQFGTLDFAGSTDGDHILVALSSLFIGASGTPGNLSSLIANFQSDLAANGTITDAATKAALLSGAQSVNPVQVAANLTARYSSVGVSFTASDISNWLDANGDGVIGKFKFQLSDATPTSVFTFPDFVVNQVAGTQISATGGQLSVNGSPVNGPIHVSAGDVVSVSPGGAKFPSGLLNVYLLTGTTRVARVQFVSQLLSLTVTPPQASIAKGLSQQFAAMGTFSDASIVDITSAVVWTSATPTVATVVPTSGVAQALSPGSTVITATLGTVSGTSTLNVTAAVLESISVQVRTSSGTSPPPLFVGHSTQLSALGFYSDSTSADVTTVSQWTSNNPSVATVGPTSGLVQAVSAGSATITATVGSVSGSLAVAPQAVVLVSIAVSPSPAYVGIGVGLQLSAIATNNDGSTADVTTTAHWASSTPSVATIGSTTGLITGMATGPATISASIGSVSSSAPLSVLSNQWSRAGSLAAERGGHTATLLTSGKVLVVGGGVGGLPAGTIAELFDPITQAWTTVANLATPTLNSTATLLPDGTVLVVGATFSSPAAATAELYDPVANTWANTAGPASVHQSPTATLLQNGKVLVAGGLDENDAVTLRAELYDPVAKTWSPATDLLTSRINHTATLLPDGKVLLAGGSTGVPGSLTAISTADLYDPVANTWAHAANLSTPRTMHTATLLSNGKVLVAGGDSVGNGLGAQASAELYDAVANAWTSTGSLNIARNSHTSTMLPNGTVLITGGYICVNQPGGGCTGTDTMSTEIYDPVTGLWNVAGNLTTARDGHAASLLHSGAVLVEGGDDRDSPYFRTSELYWFH